ncbi:MAG: hypothetical protein J5U17_08305 [Candidatus Methanoperedens sp.]|nr:hypothetical protein [Candidatus Methanoperedens sp.]MCE8429333.1 hypothetical protein [Candidatus Methanoperedens sp.]
MRISDYYMTAHLYEPPDFTKREFGFRKNDEKIVRHKAFSSVQKLRTFLIETAPDHVYFSSSKYADPAVYPMEDKKKGWRGSDLVFDIDYDHLKRPTLREAKKQSEKLLVILKDDLGFRKLLYVDSGSCGSMSMCTIRACRNWAILRLQTFSAITGQSAEERLSIQTGWK